MRPLVLSPGASSHGSSVRWGGSVLFTEKLLVDLQRSDLRATGTLSSGLLGTFVKGNRDDQFQSLSASLERTGVSSAWKALGPREAAPSEPQLQSPDFHPTS